MKSKTAKRLEGDKYTGFDQNKTKVKVIQMNYILKTEEEVTSIECDKVLHKDTHTIFVKDGEAVRIIRNDQIVDLKVDTKDSTEYIPSQPVWYHPPTEPDYAENFKITCGMHQVIGDNNQ